MKYVVVLLSVAALASAQDPVASLEGSVRDASGAPVAAVKVTVENLDTGATQPTSTASNGVYRFALLPVGRYAVAIDHPGFARFRQQPVQLNIGRSVRLDIGLQLAS